MRIQCTKCQSMNPPSEEKCQTCGADLLPGFSKLKRISSIILAVVAMIFFGYLGFMFLRLPHASGLVLVPFVLLIGLAALLLWAAIKGPAKPVRYVFRAQRHLKIDLDQAYADFTEAVRLQPSLLLAHQGRSSLYDKVDLSIADLCQEIEFLTGTLRTSGRSREKLREVLAHQIMELSQKRINRETEMGLANESLNHTLQLLDFIEANIADIHQFKTTTLGFGTGVTLHLRGQLRKNIQKTRAELYRGGLVKAIGYCRRCKEDVEPDLDLDCSRNKSHGQIDKVRFFVPDTPSKSLER